MTTTRAARRSRRRGRRTGAERDDGYVLALTALLLVPLLLASALAVDVGTWYARITQLQRAADAAALAGTIWMPDLTKATSVANESLAKNGIVNGADGISVTIGPGGSSTSLKVSIREAKTDAYFSQVIGWSQSLSRSAEAEYYLPLPLGSPLNYFGGDASKNSSTTTTDPPTDYRTNKPTNSQQCKFATDGGKGYKNGTYTTRNIDSRWDNCTWEVESTDQIDPAQSPGFWAMVAGPGTAAGRGDAFSARCNGEVNCTAPSNLMSRDTGYWYVIKMPANATTTTVSIYDASYNMGDGSTVNAGDINLDNDSTVFTTEYRVYRQDSALDVNVRTPLASSPSNADNSCYWQVTNQSAYSAAWKPLCRITNPQPGSTYLLNVKTTQNQNRGSGLNGYALKAEGTSTSSNPAVYAYGDMAMYNNIVGGDATFYLAEVGPEYAGKVLLIDLFDSGDANGTATLYPMMPSTTATRPVRNVAAGDCTYTASPSPNPSVTSSSAPGGATSASVTTAHGSDVSGSCGVTTVSNNSTKFNNEWVHLRIKVPSDYTCTKGLNPNTAAGSCWWGIKYSFSAEARDVTTWKASIEGNPVHLVQ